MSVEEAAATYGFETVKTEFITEYNSHATLFRHTKTGAELMSLVNDDENKTFGAVFRTPPANSTGASLPLPSLCPPSAPARASRRRCLPL